MNTINCDIHGEQGIGLVCTHIAHAIDSRDKVGFITSKSEDTEKPDAWCSECERNLTTNSEMTRKQWFEQAGFKILCASCWDEARNACK